MTLVGMLKSQLKQNYIMIIKYLVNQMEGEVLFILPFGSTLLKMERMFFLKHFDQSIEGNFWQ